MPGSNVPAKAYRLLVMDKEARAHRTATLSGMRLGVL